MVTPDLLLGRLRQLWELQSGSAAGPLRVLVVRTLVWCAAPAVGLWLVRLGKDAAWLLVALGAVGVAASAVAWVQRVRSRAPPPG